MVNPSPPPQKKNRVSYVKYLKPCKDTWCIKVRVIHLRRNNNKESGSTIEMVLVDKELSSGITIFFATRNRLLFFITLQ